METNEFHLTYLEQAVDMFKEAIERGEHITFYGDYDFDGLTCLLQFKKLMEMLGYDNYSILHYTKRTHSIDTNLASLVLQNGAGLCIICDAGCSEPETLQYLTAITKVIVLDHHRGTIVHEHISDSLVVVNPTLWEDGLQMSAGCVTYELIMAWVAKVRPDDYEHFQRVLVFYPFASIYADGAYGPNDYCYTIYDKAQTAVFPHEFNFAQKNFVSTKRFVLFSVAPPINAAFRNNRLDLINSLFLRKEPLLSYERADLLDDLANLRSDMRKHIAMLDSLVQPKMIGEFALVDLTGYLNQGINNEVIWANKGLIANKVAERTKSACVCIVSSGDSYSVSVRDYYGRDILSLMQTFYQVGGHPSAFGGTIATVDVINLSRVLGILSKRLPERVKRKVLNYVTLKPADIERIALLNEFEHPNRITLIEILKARTKMELTPASWGTPYYQYHLPLGVDKTIYVRQEEFDVKENPKILIQLYRGKRIMGQMVAEA